MIFVYRRSGSESADDLADIMDGRRVRFYDERGFARREGRIPRIPKEGDTIVCWGENFTHQIPGVRVLNGGITGNKLEEALKLKAAGVPTIEVARTRPLSTTPPDPTPGLWAATRSLTMSVDRPTEAVMREMLGNLTAITNSLQHPPTPQVWLGRRYNHQGGSDLLSPPSTPDFFVKKEPIVREFRIHIFEGKSIRAGVKGPKEGSSQHPWIRSYESGWIIHYNGFSSSKEMRKIAGDAVGALGLQFGGVDLGEKADGSLIVLEVNRACGLEGTSIEAYANAIKGGSSAS